MASSSSSSSSVAASLSSSSSSFELVATVCGHDSASPSASPSASRSRKRDRDGGAADGGAADDDADMTTVVETKRGRTSMNADADADPDADADAVKPMDPMDMLSAYRASMSSAKEWRHLVDQTTFETLQARKVSKEHLKAAALDYLSKTPPMLMQMLETEIQLARAAAAIITPNGQLGPWMRVIGQALQTPRYAHVALYTLYLENHAPLKMEQAFLRIVNKTMFECALGSLDHIIVAWVHFAEHRKRSMAEVLQLFFERVAPEMMMTRATSPMTKHRPEAARLKSFLDWIVGTRYFDEPVMTTTPRTDNRVVDPVTLRERAMVMVGLAVRFAPVVVVRVVLEVAQTMMMMIARPRSSVDDDKVEDKVDDHEASEWRLGADATEAEIEALVEALAWRQVLHEAQSSSSSRGGTEAVKDLVDMLGLPCAPPTAGSLRIAVRHADPTLIAVLVSGQLQSSIKDLSRTRLVVTEAVTAATAATAAVAEGLSELMGWISTHDYPPARLSHSACFDGPDFHPVAHVAEAPVRLMSGRFGVGKAVWGMSVKESVADLLRWCAAQFGHGVFARMLERDTENPLPWLLICNRELAFGTVLADPSAFQAPIRVSLNAIVRALTSANRGEKTDDIVCAVLTDLERRFWDFPKLEWTDVDAALASLVRLKCLHGLVAVVRSPSVRVPASSLGLAFLQDLATRIKTAPETDVVGVLSAVDDVFKRDRDHERDSSSAASSSAATSAVAWADLRDLWLRPEGSGVIAAWMLRRGLLDAKHVSELWRAATETLSADCMRRVWATQFDERIPSDVRARLDFGLSRRAQDSLDAAFWLHTHHT